MPSRGTGLPHGEDRARIAQGLAFFGVPASDERALHPRLEMLLQRLQAAERGATGADRRPTFRLMREILGACVELEVPGGSLAACLDTSRESLRRRASGPHGTISAELIRHLTDLSPDELDDLSSGELTRDDEPAVDDYSTVAFIRALLKTPPPEPQRG